MTDETAYVNSQIQEIMPSYDEKDYPSLSPEEILFVYTYLAYGNNPGRAYMEVFGADNNTQARAKAFHLLKKKPIIEAINKMQEAIFQYALHSLPNALLVDIQTVRNIKASDIYDDDGMAKPLNSIPDDIQRYLKVHHLINNKTGAIVTEYDIIGKDDAITKIIELLKMRNMSASDDSAVDESAAMMAARRKRDEVLKELDGVKDT